MLDSTGYSFPDCFKREVRKARAMRRMGWSDADIARKCGTNAAYAHGLEPFLHDAMRDARPELRGLRLGPVDALMATIDEIYECADRAFEQAGFELLFPYLCNVRVLTLAERAKAEERRMREADDLAAAAFEDQAYGSD